VSIVSHNVPEERRLHLHYQDVVQRGLAYLSVDHRTILVLHDLEELPQKEIADILTIPVGTVKSRLFHARAAMRQFLQKQQQTLRKIIRWSMYEAAMLLSSEAAMLERDRLLKITQLDYLRPFIDQNDYLLLTSREL